MRNSCPTPEVKDVYETFVREHPRRAAGLLEALPVGGDVARVADGDAVHVGRVAEDVDDLEGRCPPYWR